MPYELVTANPILLRSEDAPMFRLDPFHCPLFDVVECFLLLSKFSIITLCSVLRTQYFVQLVDMSYENRSELFEVVPTLFSRILFVSFRLVHFWFISRHRVIRYGHYPNSFFHIEHVSRIYGKQYSIGFSRLLSR